MDCVEITKNLLRSALQLGDRADKLTTATPIMGNFPEFNSLTAVGLMTGIEEQLGCEIDDTEITEEIFQTVGTLAQFIEQKMHECG